MRGRVARYALPAASVCCYARCGRRSRSSRYACALKPVGSEAYVAVKEAGPVLRERVAYVFMPAVVATARPSPDVNMILQARGRGK